MQHATQSWVVGFSVALAGVSPAVMYNRDTGSPKSIENGRLAWKVALGGNGVIGTGGTGPFYDNIFLGDDHPHRGQQRGLATGGGHHGLSIL